jgi:uncharacterized caspase-like protein
MRFLLAFLALVAFANVDLSARADTQRRVALVIGNSAYKYVNKLPNPANDAAAVAAMLTSVGFDVIESKTNLTITQMKKAIRDFTEQTRGADIGVIYYAGHGIEVDGTNYMIPVDAELARDIDIEDEAVSLDRIVKVLEPARRLRLVILDACRDNPFSRTMQRTVGTRSIGRGLAKIEVQTSDTLIAFAAKAGSTAADGDGTNSPFTTALTKNLATPGLDLRLAFGQVRDDVLRATANRQEPFVYGSLGGSTVALVPAPQAAASQAAAPAAQADIRQDYQLAERIGTKEAWEQFLSIYDKGFYAGLARAARDKLVAEEQRIAAKLKADADSAASASAELKAKAEADAKAAAQAAADAKAKVEAEAKAAAQAAAAKAEAAAKAVAQAAADAKAKIEAEAKAAAQQAEKIVVAVAMSAQSADSGKPAVDIAATARSLQTELRRVGCYSGDAKDEWTADARRALERFNKNAGTKFDIKVASIDTLDAVRGKTGRICPLSCSHGFKPDGDNCVKITCPAGQVVGDDNTCEKPAPKRAERSINREPERAPAPAQAAPRAQCYIMDRGTPSGSGTQRGACQ